MEEKFAVSRVKKSYGSYSYSIEGFSGLTAVPGECIESPEFFLCGHIWQLRIFPGGSADNHREYVSFYLASKSTRVAKANYKLIVQNQILGLEDETFTSNGVRIFEPKGTQIDGWGRDKFMSIALLNDPDLGFCVDDTVTFKVEITVHGELENIRYPALHGRKCTTNPETLSERLWLLWSKSIACDVVFIVGQSYDRIPAHRSILMASSPVFFAMFSHNTQEPISGEIMVPDFEFSVIKELLYFIYRGHCSDNLGSLDIDITALLRSAAKYQLHDLLSICEDYFSPTIAENNVIGLLQLADSYNATRLKIQCMRFVAENIPRINQMKEMRELDDELQDDINRLILAINKRKGCGGSIPSGVERRFSSSTCVIM